MTNPRPHIESFPLGIDTTVYATEFTSALPSQRRASETTAVALLIDAAFGSKATITHRPDGAPMVDGIDSNVHISVSHSASIAILAVNATRKIGIDIELPRPTQLRRIASKFLTLDETIHYGSSPQTLLLAWTAKEALFKAIGNPSLTVSQILLPPLPQQRNENIRVNILSQSYVITHTSYLNHLLTLAENV